MFNRTMCSVVDITKENIEREGEREGERKRYRK